MIKIEKMNIDHVDKVLDIEKASFLHSVWKKLDFIKAVKSKQTLCDVIINDSEVTGYIIVQTVKPKASILNLAVDEKFRGEGFGSKLLDHTLDKLKAESFIKVFLEVRISNQKARKLYKTSGFDLIYIKKKYYQNNEDALVLECNL